MIMNYDLLHQKGVDAMDPDNPPPGVALRMEYSSFCQGWLPHLLPEEGEWLLKQYSLDAEYSEFQPVPTNLHKCGGCGSELHTLPGARQVVCKTCGRTIDIACPAASAEHMLSFPVSINQLLCPYCNTDNHRV